MRSLWTHRVALAVGAYGCRSRPGSRLSKVPPHCDRPANCTTWKPSMPTILASALAPEWKDRLGLTPRRPPELYESADAVSDGPHAAAIPPAQTEIDVSAIFCVQRPEEVRVGKK